MQWLTPRLLQLLQMPLVKSLCFAGRVWKTLSHLWTYYWFSISANCSSFHHIPFMCDWDCLHYSNWYTGKKRAFPEFHQQHRGSSNWFLIVPKPGKKITNTFSYSRNPSSGLKASIVLSVTLNPESQNPPALSSWCCKTQPWVACKILKGRNDQTGFWACIPETSPQFQESARRTNFRKVTELPGIRFTGRLPATLKI